MRLMSCGHPRECVWSSGEGTSHCSWCSEVADLRAERDALRWRTVGVDADPPQGQWCVLRHSFGPEYAAIVRASSEDWERALSGDSWSRHHGDRWLPLPMEDGHEPP